MDEKAIINLIIKKVGHPEFPISKIGDDVAVIPFENQSLVITSDMLVFSTDVPPGMTYSQVARKSIVMSVSDLSSKGVVPYGVLVSLGIPRSMKRSEIESLIDGFSSASNDFSVKIVGGDVNETSELVINCSMFGFSDSIVKRGGAHPNELVVVSGPFGLPASGLKILMENAEADKQFKINALNSLYTPTPPFDLGVELHKNGIPTSSIDSSDGLAVSLYEISEQSGVSMRIDNIPVPDGLVHFAKMNNLVADDLVLYGGEEYEIAWTMPNEKFGLADQIAKKMGRQLIPIGRTLSKPSGSVYLTKGGKNKMVERKGWMHLN
jgi:thiamine-monophosphate kinase